MAGEMSCTLSIFEFFIPTYHNHPPSLSNPAATSSTPFLHPSPHSSLLALPPPSIPSSPPFCLLNLATPLIRVARKEEKGGEGGTDGERGGERGSDGGGGIEEAARGGESSGGVGGLQWMEVVLGREKEGWWRKKRVVIFLNFFWYFWCVFEMYLEIFWDVLL